MIVRSRGGFAYEDGERVPSQDAVPAPDPYKVCRCPVPEVAQPPGAEFCTTGFLCKCGGWVPVEGRKMEDPWKRDMFP